MTCPSSLDIWPLGLVDYEQGLALQSELHAAVSSGRCGPSLLVLEHPPVLTLGRHHQANLLLTSPAGLQKLGIECKATDRGGQITAHMPGQLVFYPILPLRELGLRVRAYVSLLEEACLRTVARWGITAQRDLKHPGLWVGKKKLAAVGLRLKAHTSLHGLSLNVNGDLQIFSHIIPCGLSGRGVINMQELSAEPLDLEHVSQEFAQNLSDLLGLKRLNWQDQRRSATFLQDKLTTTLTASKCFPNTAPAGPQSSEARP